MDDEILDTIDPSWGCDGGCQPSECDCGNKAGEWLDGYEDGLVANMWDFGPKDNTPYAIGFRYALSVCAVVMP